jgi:hypothetical protein
MTTLAPARSCEEELSTSNDQHHQGHTVGVVSVSRLPKAPRGVRGDSSTRTALLRTPLLDTIQNDYLGIRLMCLSSSILSPVPSVPYWTKPAPEACDANLYPGLTIGIAIKLLPSVGLIGK